jgi:homogentisate 1,2-dioxygenase
MYLFHQGRHTRQAHVGLPAGTFEEEFGRQGFFGPVSHLYRLHAPTDWDGFEGPLHPHCYDFLQAQPSDLADPAGGRELLLFNGDVRVSVSRRSAPMPFYFRNGDGDELYFVHEGEGEIETDFGVLSYEPGDYIVLPRVTTYRIHPKTEKNFFLIIESLPELTIPSKEIKGLIGMHALFDQSAATLAKLPEVYDERAGQRHEIRMQREGAVSSVFYPFNPLDAVGWKGDLYAWKINVRDIRPVMSHRVHLPPPAHTTFMLKNAIVCTFLPRPLEEDPDALRVPFFHRNADYDEVIFYHAGEFFSRDNIKPGMVTFHPTGFQHGPHPKALAANDKITRTNEIAVMLDTANTLHPAPAIGELEWKEYWASWKKKP